MEDSDWCMLGFLDSEVFPVSVGWRRFRFAYGPLGLPSFCGSQYTNFLYQKEMVPISSQICYEDKIIINILITLKL